MLDFIFIMIAFGLGIADGGESGTSAQAPAPAAAESAGLLAGTDETMAAAAPAAPSTGAYVAEVIRSGLLAIPKGQRESAFAVGMSHGLMMRRVVLPQVVRIITPPLTNEAINTLKNTSLLSVITVMELTLFTQIAIAATFRPFDFYIMAALIYLVMTTVLSSFANWYEKNNKIE